MQQRIDLITTNLINHKIRKNSKKIARSSKGKALCTVLCLSCYLWALSGLATATDEISGLVA